jgi:subtilisin family serine protease
MCHTAAAAAAAAAAATDLSKIISVGSIASDGALSYFTNYGANSVDLFAPGSYILSTWPVDSYTFLDGTSMVRFILHYIGSQYIRSHCGHSWCKLKAMLALLTPWFCVVFCFHGDITMSG